MIIVLKNESGSFEIGGGSHLIARLQEIQGLGAPAKEQKTLIFEGQPGQMLKQSRDLERTITMSFDFFGDERTVYNLYKIIYQPVTLYFYLSNGERRQITGYCTQSTDITKIIYHEWQSVVLQFICLDPYFYDFYETKQAISQNEDLWPNINEDGEYLIKIPSIATKRSNEAVIYNKGDINVYAKISLKRHNTKVILLEETEEKKIVLNNLTTEKSITLNYDISADELITIDLPNRMITSNINGDITNCISDDTVLGDFYLQAGNNDINIDVDGDIFAVATFSNKYISVVI